MTLEIFEAIYGLNRYDSGDPELFMVHGTHDVNPSTPFSEPVELQAVYDPLGIHSEPVPLEGKGHGAWNAIVSGKGLFELSFDFMVDRQNLTVEEMAANLMRIQPFFELSKDTRHAQSKS